jgi:hypothetical protein
MEQREQPLRHRRNALGDQLKAYVFVTYNQTPDIPQRSGSFQALVRAGNSVTAYVRTGKGETVLILRREGYAEQLWALVLEQVATGFRAILPEKVPDGAEFTLWFKSFLDGLGLGVVRVVADAHYGILCAESGLLDPELLTVLVVISHAAEYDAITRSLARESVVRVPAIIVSTETNDPHEVALLTVRQLQSNP